VRLREVGRAFLEKAVSADDRARLKPVLSEAEGGMPMNYLTLIYSVDLPESDARKIIPEPTGLEPATSAVTGRRSNQLS
jgi:hypothetical protein